MIKKYNDFILESVSEFHFNFNYDGFMSIYNTKIVPKIGEVKEVKNFMLNDVLTKREEENFNQYKQKLKDYRDDFSDSILSLDRFYRSSFSRLAGSNQNPDEDFDEIQKMLNKVGFTLDVIGKLFNPVVSTFLYNQDFKHFVSNGLDDRSGYIDMYLYKLNEKLNLNTTVWLGGEGWGYALEEQPEEEYVIKYSYGYHKTPYGKLFLDQMGISKEEFITTTYQYLRDSFRESLYPNIMSDLKKMVQTGYSSTLGDIFMPEDFDDFVTLDDDRFIISYVEMCNDFNDITDNKYENIADPDWFKETILKSMSIFSGINIQDTGEELIFND